LRCDTNFLDQRGDLDTDVDTSFRARRKYFLSPGLKEHGSYFFLVPEVMMLVQGREKDIPCRHGDGGEVDVFHSGHVDLL
jgi:hypothetical protein